jgi:hypothetical protein
VNVVDCPRDLIGALGDDLAGVYAEGGREGRHCEKYTPEVVGLLGRFSRENAAEVPRDGFT